MEQDKKQDQKMKNSYLNQFSYLEEKELKNKEKL